MFAITDIIYIYILVKISNVRSCRHLLIGGYGMYLPRLKDYFFRLFEYVMANSQNDGQFRYLFPPYEEKCDAYKFA